MRWTKVAIFLLCLVAFSLPIDYEYNKLFRSFSLALIPDGLILPPDFQKKIYFYRSDIAAILLLFIALFGMRIPAKRLFFDKKASLLWAIFLLAVLSILTSPLSYYPVVYAQLLQLFTSFVLFSLCANGFSLEWQPKLTHGIFCSIVLAGLFQSIVAIIQYFSQSPLGLTFLGEGQQWTGTFFVSDSTRWIFDSPSSQGASMILPRAHGTLSHSNVLGGFLALSLLSSYSLVMELKQSWMKKLLACLLPLQFFAMSLTFSRSALFGWGLGTLLWFALSYRQFRAPLFRFLTCLIVLSPILSISLLSKQLLARGGVLNSNALSQGSNHARIQFQNESFEVIQKHPLTGAGYQQYTGATKRSDVPHNIYLFLAAELGLPALLFFLWFLFSLFRAASQTPMTFQIASLFAIFICFLFIGGCDIYPLNRASKLMLFIPWGLLAGFCFRKEHALAY